MNQLNYYIINSIKKKFSPALRGFFFVNFKSVKNYSDGIYIFIQIYCVYNFKSVKNGYALLYVIRNITFGFKYYTKRIFLKLGFN